jgi:cell division septation protein DedD
MSMAETFSLQQGLYHKGTSAVVHMPEPKLETPRAGRVVIQVGAFREKAEAELLLRTLGEKGYNGYLDAGIVKNLGLLYRVRLRGYASERAARAAIGRLEKEEGLKGSFVLTVDGGGGRSLTPALQ